MLSYQYNNFHYICTRAMFETSNYPRPPWDLYTAPNSKCIGAEHPPPPPPPPPKNKQKNKNNEKLLILAIGLDEKIGRTVKQSSDLKTSSIPVPLQSLEAQLSKVFHLWLFVDTVRLPCAFRFAPIFMVQSHFRYCCQSIKKIHVIIET